MVVIVYGSIVNNKMKGIVGLKRGKYYKVKCREKDKIYM